MTTHHPETAVILRELALTGNARVLVLGGALSPSMPAAGGRAAPVTAGHAQTEHALCIDTEGTSDGPSVALQRGHAPVSTSAFDQGFEAGREAGREAGYQAGFERGQADGRSAAAMQAEAARAAREERLASLDDLVAGLQSALDAQRSKVVLDVEADLLEMLFDLVCRLVGERATSREGLLALIRQAVRTLPGRRVEHLRVAPADLDLLGDDLSQQELPGQVRGTVNWLADPDVDAGGCVVQYTEGSLDARLGSRLECLRATLVEAHAARCRGVLTAAFNPEPGPT